MARRRTLGTFDRAQALTSSLAAYNIVTVVRLGTVLDRTDWQSGLELLTKRHPILRASIPAGTRSFETSASSPLTLLHEKAENDDAWLACAERELDFRFDLSAPPLGRCTILEHPAIGSTDLVLTFPHALVDGTAVTQLVRELLENVSRTDDKAEATVPLEADLPPACDELFPAAWRRPRRLLSSALFLGRQMGGEIAYRLATRGRHSRPPAGAFRNRVLPISLSESETEDLVRASRRNRVSLVAVLEAAMLIAVTRHCFPGISMPHRYCAFPLLRKYLEPPVADDAVACYITVLRLAARVSGDDELWALATTIHEDLNRSMRRGERFLASVWSLFSMRMIFAQSSHRMSTTALSYTGSTTFPAHASGPEVRGVHAFVSNFPIGPQYTAQARIFDRRLWLDILYLNNDLDDRMARQIGDDMLDLLRRSKKEGGRT